MQTLQMSYLLCYAYKCTSCAFERHIKCHKTNIAIRRGRENVCTVIICDERGNVRKTIRWDRGGEAFKTIRWEGRGEGMYKSDGWE